MHVAVRVQAFRSCVPVRAFSFVARNYLADRAVDGKKVSEALARVSDMILLSRALCFRLSRLERCVVTRVILRQN